MATWEYHKTSSDERLDELGREGWELVAVVPSGPSGELTLYLKRPTPGFREQVTEDQKMRYYTLQGIEKRSSREADSER
jgi:hypothetical protein